MKKVIELLKKKLETASAAVSLFEKGISQTKKTRLNKVKSFILELQQAIDILEKQAKVISLNPLVIKSGCECSFAMIRRDEKTQKAYCFECKKEIQE